MPVVTHCSPHFLLTLMHITCEALSIWASFSTTTPPSSRALLMATFAWSLSQKSSLQPSKIWAVLVCLVPILMVTAPGPVHFILHFPSRLRYWAMERRGRGGKVGTTSLVQSSALLCFLLQAGPFLPAFFPGYPPTPGYNPDSFSSAFSLAFFHLTKRSTDPSLIQFSAFYFSSINCVSCCCSLFRSPIGLIYQIRSWGLPV